jgi:hypothetical protein
MVRGFNTSTGSSPGRVATSRQPSWRATKRSCQNLSVSHCPTRRLCRCRQGLEIVGCERPADSALAPSAGTPIKLDAMVDGHLTGSHTGRQPMLTPPVEHDHDRWVGVSPSPAATLAISCADAEQVSRHSPGAPPCTPSFNLRRLPPVHQPIHLGHRAHPQQRTPSQLRRSAGASQRSRMNRQASTTYVG